MDTPDQILERIKKLLRMKRGGTQEEVATALRLAQKLADEHGIDLGRVNPDERTDDAVGCDETEPKSRLQWECIYAGQILEGHFNVKAVVSRSWRGSCLRLVGTKLDRRIAIYVFHFLVGHFRREWRTNRGRLRNRRAFMYGMFLGLYGKLDQQRQGLAEADPLAVVLQNKQAANEAWVKEHCGPLKQVESRPDTNAQAAMHQGWKAGRATEIRPAVEQPAARRFLPAIG